LRYIEKPFGSFVDRKQENSNQETIDVIMLTLDAENFLEKSLFTIYREIPVRRLIVCDGGSKDLTLSILKKFPRVEIHERPDIRTTGKVLEFLISLTETDWFVIIDSDIELERGWYDEMKKHENEFDVLENGKVILAYHMYKEYKEKMEKDHRSSDFCHLVKKSAVKNYHLDDDYMWRFTDFFFQQVVEKSGFSYGKINTTMHIHNETERIPYKSDNEKNFSKYVWEKPKIVVIDKKKAREFDIKHAKAIVKYLDPDFPPIKKNKGIGLVIKTLDRDWVKKNGHRWLDRYDKKQIILKIKKSLLKFGYKKYR